MLKLDLEKAEEPEIKLPTSAGSSKKEESSRKTSISALLTRKSFECVDHNKLWKILKEMGIPDHLTCFLRNLYAGQEATVRTQHGTTDLFHSEKEYIKAVYCHPAYLTYAEYIIWNARLDDAQAGIKITRRNINYLRYTDDTTLITEKSESENEVAQFCLTIYNPMDCSLPGSSIHGIFQASILEWVAISFFRGSSRMRDWTQISHIAGRCFTIWATREALMTENEELKILLMKVKEESEKSCLKTQHSKN